MFILAYCYVYLIMGVYVSYYGSLCFLLLQIITAILQLYYYKLLQLYFNSPSSKYSNFGVYFHIIWVKEHISDEI